MYSQLYQTCSPLGGQTSDTKFINPNNNPLKDMLLKCFDGSVNFEKNRKKTLNEKNNIDLIN